MPVTTIGTDRERRARRRHRFVGSAVQVDLLLLQKSCTQSDDADQGAATDVLPSDARRAAMVTGGHDRIWSKTLICAGVRQRHPAAVVVSGHREDEPRWDGSATWQPTETTQTNTSFFLTRPDRTGEFLQSAGGSRQARQLCWSS
jgi:hypothetical protein